jgi:hypothetical protein
MGSGKGKARRAQSAGADSTPMTGLDPAIAVGLAAQAEWSVELSIARSLGDNDMVLEVAKHCGLGKPSPDVVAEIVRSIVLDNRARIPNSDLAQKILEAII